MRTQNGRNRLVRRGLVPSWNLTTLGGLLRCASMAATLLVAGSPAGGATVHVDRSVPSSGDGTSWPTAFKTIHEGIEAAETGDDVVVAEGTYVETVDFIGKSITVHSTDPTDPAVVRCTVIKASDSPEAVRFRSFEDRGAVLAGFTVTGGQVGVYCVWSQPVIRDNLIEANAADFDEGGGISCYYASAFIMNNTIASNLARAGGAGIACEGAEPVITGNLILGNVTDMEGGGILCVDCAPTISFNRIIGNVCQGNGGGLALRRAEADVTTNLIVSNVSDSLGGGVFSYHSVARLLGNTISQNAAQADGGGGLYFSGSSGTIVNCILWANGDDLSGCTATFSCVEDDGPEDQGEGNIHDPPLFVDPDGEDELLGTEDDDYRLAADSPCRDRGSFSAATRLLARTDSDNLLLSWDVGLDLLGEERVSGTGVDMGCYEYPGAAAAYLVEFSLDLLAWTALHSGRDTQLLLAPWPPHAIEFFRVSVIP